MRSEFEVLKRIIPKLSPEQREELEAERIVPSFDEDEWYDSNVKPAYRPFTFDLQDVEAYEMLDRNHTLIYLKGHLTITAKVAYDVFQGMRESTLQILTRKIQDFEVVQKLNSKS